jgi:hypothetical protein
MHHVKNGQLDADYRAFKYTDLSVLRKTLKDSQLTHENATYIYWKMTDICYTAVEKSQGFIDMLSLFLAIGRRTLEMLGTQPEIDAKKCPLKVFCKHINKLKMPLTPGNT